MSKEVRLKCSPMRQALNVTAIEMYPVEMFCNYAGQVLKDKEQMSNLEN